MWRREAVRSLGRSGLVVGGPGSGGGRRPRRVHQHAGTLSCGRPRRCAFRQLPADLATFNGREQELEALVEAIGAAPEQARTVVISAIDGMAGVGKTQLAAHASHELVRAGRFTDVQLFVNLRGFDSVQRPVDPHDVLGSFLRALAVPVAQIPVGTDERAAMYRDRLSGRSAPVVLDNAADEEQVRDLIPAGPSSLVLIASRRRLLGLDGAGSQRLGVYDRAAALALLARIAGAERVRSDPEAADAVVEACGRLPLAVALVATRLRSRPGWSMAALAGRLRRAALHLAGAGDKYLRPAFDLSYRGLTEADRRGFRLLGLHPGLDFDASAAGSLTGVSDLDACQRRLDETGAQTVRGPQAVPTGRNLTARLPGGVQIEYIAGIPTDTRHEGPPAVGARVWSPHTEPEGPHLLQDGISSLHHRPNERRRAGDAHAVLGRHGHGVRPQRGAGAAEGAAVADGDARG